MTAEAGARVKQEVVDRVRAQRRRGERIGESTGAQERQHRLHERDVGAGATAQSQGQGESAGILPSREFCIVEAGR